MVEHAWPHSAKNRFHHSFLVISNATQHVKRQGLFLQLRLIGDCQTNFSLGWYSSFLSFLNVHLPIKNQKNLSNFLWPFNIYNWVMQFDYMRGFKPTILEQILFQPWDLYSNTVYRQRLIFTCLFAANTTFSRFWASFSTADIKRNFPVKRAQPVFWNCLVNNNN